MPPARQKPDEKHRRQEKKASCRQASASGGTSASAYNPSSGTFHALDSGTHSGKLRPVDDTEDHSCVNGAAAEYDSLSNSGSCSGESEDQLNGNGKERQGSVRLETPPGLFGGIEKRDKMRWKNERKHQRQKERRVQELRDRCTGYLMSRKLEVLAQQLVAMGFLPEQATMALILNEGDLEQSVSWLLEGGEGQVQEGWNTGGTLKIDISEELAGMADIETKYEYGRLDIERAIVSCEGDLDKAVDLLRRRFQNASPVRVEEKEMSPWGKDSTAKVNDQIPLAALSPSCTAAVVRAANARGASQVLHQSGKKDRESNLSKGRLQVSSPGSSFPCVEGAPKGAQPSCNDPPLPFDLLRSPSPADERATHELRPPASSQTSFQTSASPFLSTADSSAENVPQRHSDRSEAKRVRATSRVSVLSAQGPQPSDTSTPANTCIGVSSVPDSLLSCSPSWNGNFAGALPPLHVLSVDNMLGDLSSKGEMAVKQSLEGLGTAGVDSYGDYHPLLPTQSDPVAAGWISGRTGFMASDTSYSTSNLLSSNSQLGNSLGLYSAWRTGLSGTSVDWSTGTIASQDYKNIDWSMASSPYSLSEAGRIWGLSSGLASLKLSEDSNHQLFLRKERSFHSQQGIIGLASDSNNAYDGWIHSGMKGSSTMLGLRDSAQGDIGNLTALGLHEWTSPFAGKDLFTAHHQAVPFPLL